MRLGFVPHPANGGRRLLWALVVVLVFSRHQFVFATHSQKIQDLISGLEDAWAFFGGVPHRLIVDNRRERERARLEAPPVAHLDGLPEDWARSCKIDDARLCC
jgi:hypothetical protein